MKAKKFWLYAIPWAVLILSVPWFFTGLGATWWGFPGWAVFSLGVSVVYAVLVAWFLRSGWEISSGGAEWWEDEERAD